MKRIIHSCTFVTVMLIGLIGSKQFFKIPNSYNVDFKLLNAEALAEAERIGDTNVYTNFARHTVYKLSDVEVDLIKPSFYVSYKAISCCIDASDADVCNFDFDLDDGCKYVKRSAR